MLYSHHAMLHALSIRSKKTSQLVGHIARKVALKESALLPKPKKEKEKGPLLGNPYSFSQPYRLPLLV